MFGCAAAFATPPPVAATTAKATAAVPAHGARPPVDRLPVDCFVRIGSSWIGLGDQYLLCPMSAGPTRPDLTDCCATYDLGFAAGALVGALVGAGAGAVVGADAGATVGGGDSFSAFFLAICLSENLMKSFQLASAPV
jgi:hypothetical protein